MRLSYLCVMAAVALAGCGGNAAPPKASATAAAKKTATPTGTPTPKPLSSADDVAACAELEQAVQAASSLVGHTTEGITKAQHPKDLATRVGTARESLLDAAKLINLVDPPKSLLPSQRQYVLGLRMFAADFARGKAAAAKGEMDQATQLLTDETALKKITAAAKTIDATCGA